jgi:hypothetical protein
MKTLPEQKKAMTLITQLKYSHQAKTFSKISKDREC